jgi:hypothetical protein
MQAPRSQLRVVAWSGALMLAVSVVLLLTFPRAMGPLPAGLRTPVLALELARSTHELETMFGPAGSPDRARWVAAVDRGDAIDFAFIVIYGVFLVACWRAFGSERSLLVRLGVGLVLLACAADVAENLVLFVITARLGGDYAAHLPRLMVATWVKWSSIAAALALLAPDLWRRGRWGKLVAAIAAAALPVAIGAALLRGVLAELMLLVNSLAFTAAWVESLLSLRRRTSE